MLLLVDLIAFECGQIDRFAREHLFYFGRQILEHDLTGRLIHSLSAFDLLTFQAAFAFDHDQRLTDRVRTLFAWMARCTAWMRAKHARLLARLYAFLVNVRVQALAFVASFNAFVLTDRQQFIA